VEVQTVGSAGLWQIEVDTNHLESAIVNLAINARDAMPDGGKLTLEAANISADEDYCRMNPELVPGQYVAIPATPSSIKEGLKKASICWRSRYPRRSWRCACERFWTRVNEVKSHLPARSS
jgi:hypothetical protein